jgi:hypothetical protein
MVAQKRPARSRLSANWYYTIGTATVVTGSGGQLEKAKQSFCTSAWK